MNIISRSNVTKWYIALEKTLKTHSDEIKITGFGHPYKFLIIFLKLLKVASLLMSVPSQETIDVCLPVLLATLFGPDNLIVWAELTEFQAATKESILCRRLASQARLISRQMGKSLPGKGEPRSRT